MRIPVLVAAAALGAAAITQSQSSADAKPIVVVPGPGTPLQDAIDAAAPGDAILVEGGNYPEAVVVTKPLHIRNHRAGLVRVDPGCATATTLEIASDRVNVSNVQFRGSSGNTIVIDGRDRIKLSNVNGINDCGGVGIHVSASTHVTLSRVNAQGAPAAIRLADLAGGAKVRMSSPGAAGDLSYGAPSVLLVENVAPNALQISQCSFGYANDAVIELHDADGVRINGCLVYSNTGANGVVVDAASSDNVITSLRLNFNGVDITDDGTSNCWRNNRNPSGAPVTGNGSQAGCP